MIVPSAEQIRHQLLLHVVFMRRSWPNEPEIADDMEAACSWLDTLSQEVERLKNENQMLLSRSGKPDADRDFSIHAPADKG